MSARLWLRYIIYRPHTDHLDHPPPLQVDLVGEENTGRLADTIKLLVMQVCGVAGGGGKCLSGVRG